MTASKPFEPSHETPGNDTPAFHLGGKYNWKNQLERLIYLGRNWSGNGYWHQFAKVNEPESVWCEVLDDDLLSFEKTPAEIPSAEPFQSRVRPWMMECFGAKISDDRTERNHRFLEEAVELVQSTGCTASEAHQLVDYVYGRPVGEPAQEVGGVMVTLAALCLANGLDMHAAGEVELTRIWTMVEKIRTKQAAKPKHLPLAESAEHKSAMADGWPVLRSSLAMMMMGFAGGEQHSRTVAQAEKVLDSVAAGHLPQLRGLVPSKQAPDVLPPSAPPVHSKVPIWYMRDNRTFRALTGGPQEMVEQCLEEFDAGYTCGMLCSKQANILVQAYGRERREEFRLEALAVLKILAASSAALLGTQA